MANKELAIKEQAALAANEIPDFLKKESGPTGMEGLDSDDFIVPRLTLVQTTSQDFKDRVADGGDFMNALTKENFGSEVELVLLQVKRGATYLEMGKGLVCKSDDGITCITGEKCSECPFGEYWKVFKDNKPPKCSKTYNFIVVERKSLKTDTPTVMLLSMMKTSATLAKSIVSRARSFNKPLFSQSIKFNSEVVKHPKGDYYNYKVSYPGWVTAEEFSKLKAINESFKNVTIKEHTSEVSASDDQGEEVENF